MAIARLAIVALILLVGTVTRAGAQTPAPAAAPDATADQHQGHGQAAPQPSPPAAPPAGGEQGHAAPGVPPPQLRAFIPAITDDDRKAAFPDVQGHAVHDTAVHSFVLFDQLEWQAGSGGRGLSWDNKSWVGTDLDRLWVRSEGETGSGRVEHAELQLLYGRAFARWWEVVAGLRQDFRPGPQQTWAAVGIQGLAPQWFELEATAYVGEGGQTAARLEAEYELLLTNRLMLQPLVELNLYGKSNPARGIGSGISRAEAGLRLRYEVRRELAPYVGVTWGRGFGKTADFARAAGETVNGARLVAGVRAWF